MDVPLIGVLPEAPFLLALQEFDRYEGRGERDDRVLITRRKLTHQWFLGYPHQSRL